MRRMRVSTLNLMDHAIVTFEQFFKDLAEV